MYVDANGYHYALLMVNGKNKYVGLGREYGKALQKYAAEVAPINKCRTRTFGDLLTRYVSTILPTKSPRYCYEQTRVSKFVLAGLGEMPLTGVSARAINQYLTYRVGQSTNAQVQKERALIAGIIKMGLTAGELNDNPMPAVPSRCGVLKSNRVIEPQEILAFYEFCRGHIIGDYLRFKVLTGLRKSDILAIHRRQIREDGIHVTPGKTAQRTGKTIINWSPALRDVVKDLLGRSMFLFCRKDGQPYTYSGFNSMWQRQMRAAHHAGILQERFKDSDLRSFVADSLGLEHAKVLLAHATARTTESRYRRRPRNVDPSA